MQLEEKTTVGNSCPVAPLIFEVQRKFSSVMTRIFAPLLPNPINSSVSGDLLNRCFHFKPSESRYVLTVPETFVSPDPLYGPTLIQVSHHSPLVYGPTFAQPCLLVR